MRMWMVDPKIMCRQHLLGEHVELHMLVGSITKGRSIDGFIENGLVEPQSISKRHEELVSEMLNRGYNHKSPIVQPKLHPYQHADIYNLFDCNLKELINRCDKCKKRCFETELSKIR